MISFRKPKRNVRQRRKEEQDEDEQKDVVLKAKNKEQAESWFETFVWGGCGGGSGRGHRVIPRHGDALAPHSSSPPPPRSRLAAAKPT